MGAMWFLSTEEEDADTVDGCYFHCINELGKGEEKRVGVVVASHMRLVYHVAFSAAFGCHGTGWQITTFV
jgi:hypothetical protein